MADYQDDVERVERDYVDPQSVTRQQVRQDLEEAGIEGNAADMFESNILTVDAAMGEVPEAGPGEIRTRQDVERSVMAMDGPGEHGGDPDPARAQAIARDAAVELGAPDEAELTRARREAVSNLDGSVLRSNPDLDPLAEGGQGREIVDIQDAGGKLGGDESPVRETVERTGRDTATFYYVGDDGTRYPMAEVDL